MIKMRHCLATHSVYFRFMAVVAWMGIIFALSAQSGTSSAGLSLAICRWVAETIASVDIFSFLPEWLSSPYELAEKMHFVVRKAAHVTEYAILGVLLCRFVEKIMHGRNIFVVSFFVGFAYACTDELHQFFVSGRGASFTDVLIDSCGVLFGVACVYLLWRRKDKVKL